MDVGGLWYRRDGSGPIGWEQWHAEGNELGPYARVAYTDIGEVYVSTIFLGLNHRFSPGPPLIFETMVFGGVYDQEQERYPTEGVSTRRARPVGGAGP